MADYFSPHSQSRAPSENDDDAKSKRQQLLSFQQGVVGANSADSSSPRSISVRKPRGRPPGSKNKPKPPVVVTNESPSAMHPLFLEISPNYDILESVFDFARRRRAAISVLAGTGPVSDVSLRHPTVHASTVTLAGRFEILSLSGSFLPGSGSSRPFAISLAGPQGQVIGGMVAGPLMAAGTVALTAASFLSPEIYRLPIVSSQGGDREDEQQQRLMAKDEEHGENDHYVGGGGCGSVGPRSTTSQHEMVLWGSPATTATPRAPPPHSHRPPPPAHY